VTAPDQCCTYVKKVLAKAPSTRDPLGTCSAGTQIYKRGVPGALRGKLVRDGGRGEGLRAAG
jgi:hypothetical protein